jgi:membrane protein implicated in regulation of membrane protease activity
VSPPRTTGGRPSRLDGRLLLAGLCLLTPFVTMLWVASYATEEPTLGGFPFFYWYQLLWIFITVTLTLIAYALVLRVEREHRAQREAERRARRGESARGVSSDG